MTANEKNDYIKNFIAAKRPISTYTAKLPQEDELEILRDLESKGFLNKLAINHNTIHISFNTNLQRFIADGGYSVEEAEERIYTDKEIIMFVLKEMNENIQYGITDLIKRNGENNILRIHYLIDLMDDKGFIKKMNWDRNTAMPTHLGQTLTLEKYDEIMSGISSDAVKIIINNMNNHGLSEPFLKIINKQIISEDKKPTIWAKVKVIAIKYWWAIIIPLALAVLTKIIERTLDNYPLFPCWNCQ